MLMTKSAIVRFEDEEIILHFTNIAAFVKQTLWKMDIKQNSSCNNLVQPRKDNIFAKKFLILTI